MHLEQVGGRCYAQLDRLRHLPSLIHAFSTRPADLAPRPGPNAAATDEQRRRMVADWGLDPDQLRYCQQVHGQRLVVVDQGLPAGRVPECDGLLTDRRAVPLMTFSADCPLVLVIDAGRRALGMAHASWRCTVARIAFRLVELMVARFGCRPAELWAGIGPGAGPCCYQVQADVYQAAAGLPDRERCFARRAGRLYFDLWQANVSQLEQAGLERENIELAGICTMCERELFHSYRREGKGCGHFALMAAWR